MKILCIQMNRNFGTTYRFYTIDVYIVQWILQTDVIQIRFKKRFIATKWHIHLDQTSFDMAFVFYNCFFLQKNLRRTGYATIYSWCQLHRQYDKSSGSIQMIKS